MNTSHSRKSNSWTVQEWYIRNVNDKFEKNWFIYLFDVFHCLWGQTESRLLNYFVSMPTIQTSFFPPRGISDFLSFSSFFWYSLAFLGLLFLFFFKYLFAFFFGFLFSFNLSQTLPISVRSHHSGKKDKCFIIWQLPLI